MNNRRARYAICWDGDTVCERKIFLICLFTVENRNVLSPGHTDSSPFIILNILRIARETTFLLH